MMLPATMLAGGIVKFKLTGLEQGDKAVVSISSSEYLATMSLDADGEYSFSNVPAGSHAVKVDISGYNTVQAQKVIVGEDGSVQPQEPLRIAITKKSDDPNTWNFSWEEDASTAGYTTTSHVNVQPEVEFLGKKIVPSDVPSMSILMNDYRIILVDDEEPWTQEFAYRLLETMKTIPVKYYEMKQGKFKLTSESLSDDIEVTDLGDGYEVRISKDAFYYANPYLVNLDGVRGRFFSKRLHHAMVNYVTNFGQDEDRAHQILVERFGCEIMNVDYAALTAGITNEDETHFQKFVPSELVAIINMFEELPEGFHKTPHLNYLIRRINGMKHPLYPDAAAVSWCVDNGYIEFMESAFGGNNEQFDTQRLILHEKTHFLWAYSFSDEIKNDWAEVGGWYKDPNTEEGWSTTKDVEFVTQYAHGKNPNEDMAESVAYYLKNPDKLESRAPEKYEFIRDRIMHGTRYISQIRSDLTFEVLNLYPDYDYPGKIKRLDIKVEGAPEEDKTLTLEVELNDLEGFEDGASNGITRVSSPVFYDNGEKCSQFYDLWIAPVDGNNHLLRGSITISKYSKSGYWTAGDITINDEQGNQRFEGRNDCVWNCYINNSEEDVEAPKYVPNSLNYELTDTIVDGHKAQNLHVSYKITDNKGIDRTFVRINRANSGYNYDTYGTWDPETQTAHIDILVTEYFPTGDYWATDIAFYDYAQTCKSVYFTDNPEDQPIKKIYIQTADPDTIPAELDLNRITVYAEPTHPEAPDGETKVTIHFYARDDKSGFGHCSYNLRDPQGVDHFEWFYHENFYTTYYVGDPTVWTHYTIKCVLPQGSAPGIWGLSALALCDKAGNDKTYNFVETLIFEPDDSSTDYVLFSEMSDDYCVNLKVSSETVATFGFNYRIISEETGQEISGSSSDAQNAKAARAASDDFKVDVSSLPDGELVVIVNILGEDGEVVAVRTNRLTKNSTSGIHDVEINTKGKVDVYNVQGIRVKHNVNDGDWRHGLSKGVYIVNGQKYTIK